MLKGAGWRGKWVWRGGRKGGSEMKNISANIIYIDETLIFVHPLCLPKPSKRPFANQSHFAYIGLIFILNFHVICRYNSGKKKIHTYALRISTTFSLLSFLPRIPCLISTLVLIINW